jgi:hypothetical protein
LSTYRSYRCLTSPHLRAPMQARAPLLQADKQRMPETCPPVCGCRMTSQNSSRRAEKPSKEDCREPLPNVSIQHSSPSLSLTISHTRCRCESNREDERIQNTDDERMQCSFFIHIFYKSPPSTHLHFSPFFFLSSRKVMLLLGL